MQFISFFLLSENSHEHLISVDEHSHHKSIYKIVSEMVNEKVTLQISKQDLQHPLVTIGILTLRISIEYKTQSEHPHFYLNKRTPPCLSS